MQNIRLYSLAILPATALLSIKDKAKQTNAGSLPVLNVLYKP